MQQQHARHVGRRTLVGMGWWWRSPRLKFFIQSWDACLLLHLASTSRVSRPPSSLAPLVCLRPSAKNEEQRRNYCSHTVIRSMENAKARGNDHTKASRKRSRDEEDATAKQGDDNPAVKPKNETTVVSTNTAADPQLRAAKKETPSVTSTILTDNRTDTVYIGGLPHHYCTEPVIQKIFAPHGTIARINVITPRSGDSHNKCFAFCQFATVEQASKAIAAVNGRLLGGRKLVVRPAHQNKQQAALTSLLLSSTSTAASTSPRRQQQQLDSRIEAIQKKLRQKEKNLER